MTSVEIIIRRRTIDAQKQRENVYIRLSGDYERDTENSPGYLISLTHS